MILGYNTNGFSSHSLDAAIDIVAELGYGCIAITVDHHALNPFLEACKADRAACASRLKAANLIPVVETGARFLLDPRRKHRPNLLDEDADARGKRVDFLCRCVDIAVDIGAGVVSLWSGTTDSVESAEVLDERLRAGLQLVCDKAASCGIQIAFEPEPGMHIESMADFDRLCEGFSHPSFGLTLDLGHAFLTEDSVHDTIDKYLSRIVNVHVEGMRRPNHDHLVPWDSGYDVGAALKHLQRAGYVGPATLELSRSSHDAVRIAAKAIEYLQPRTS
jgi:sugar phosphate isomerase/epimerase